MTKEEFIGKLQMCYFGDRNAFDEIVGEYDRLNNIINELEKYIKTEIPEEEFINNEWYVNVLDKLKELKDSD